MNTNTKRLATRAVVAAGRAALAAVALAAFASGAAAQSDQAPEKPESTAEVGAGAVADGNSTSPFKATEYNGLPQSGAFFIGNFDLRGGGAYDSDNAARYRLTGTDLGLHSRSLYGEAGVQGKFRVFGGYDEIRRNRSDTYQTPYNGAGTATLTLPASWLVPTIAGVSGSNLAANNFSGRGLVPSIGGAPYLNSSATSPTYGALLTPTAAQLALVNGAAAADVPLFHNFDIYTTRNRFNVGVMGDPGSAVGFDARFVPEHKDGTRLMGTVSRQQNGDVSTIIPVVVDNNHYQATANISLKGSKSYLQAGYYGSYFHNNAGSMSWQNWSTGTPGAPGTLLVNVMSDGAPSNDFSQFNALGGITFTKTTKLTANVSYGRNTQNDPFMTDASTPVVPVGSLNGLVVNTDAGVRFTARPAKKVNVTADYRYDDRDNRTPVNIYQYADAGEAPTPAGVSATLPAGYFPAGPQNPLGAVLAQNANENRPYSKKLNQFQADADFGIAPGQWVKGGYRFERINRWCTGTWIDCADAGVTNENAVRAEWRATAGVFNARVDYQYAQRRAPDYNENAFLALVPYAGVVPAGQTMSALQAMNQAGLTGYGPVLGYNNGVFVNGAFFPSNNALSNGLYANNNRISELIGMRRYYVADRNQNRLRTLWDWQATEAFDLQANVNYTDDKYPNSTYGLQDSKNWSFTLDGSYALMAGLTADVFYTYENFDYETAGNSYTGNSNAAAITGAQPTATGLSGNAACDPYTTLLQRNNNAKLDPCLNWSTDMQDKVHTAGVGVRRVAGKLDIAGHFILSRADSDNTVTGGNWANNPVIGPGAVPTTIAAYFIPASPLPTVTTNSGELRLDGRYSFTKSSAVRVLYSYLRMTSADWMYESMQIGPGTLSGVLPTNEQPFSYSMNIVGVSYIFTF